MPPERRLPDLYDPESDDSQLARYRALAERVMQRSGSRQSPIFISSPGRTELGGNHTDHNHGQVLCAGVQNDMVAAVLPRGDQKVLLESDGFAESFDVDLGALEFMQSERGNSRALIRGVAAGLQARGHRIGGFDAVVSSTVPIGSGLSSSASFEVLVGGIFDALFNGDTIDPVVLARAGQRAENEYFGKPCGLMDQLACAIGGVLSIDFGDYENPDIQRIGVDFSNTEYRLTVIHTGGSHADLTDAYASIPREMKAAARLFGAEVLGEVAEENLVDHISQVREQLGDRTALRMLHFYMENARMTAMLTALKQKDFPSYLAIVETSGRSSLGVLQNIIPPQSDGREQPVALALGCSSSFFEKRGRGVCRVHGGGFAGTIQAYVHRDDFEEYVETMETLFGSGSVQSLRIRPFGVAKIPAKEILGAIA